MSECNHKGGIYGNFCKKCVPDLIPIKVKKLQDENRRLRECIEAAIRDLNGGNSGYAIVTLRQGIEGKSLGGR